MADETKLRGKNLTVAVWDGTSAYLPLACLTSNSINSIRQVIESLTKCDPDFVKVENGPLSQNASFEGEAIDTTSVGGYTSKASFDYLKALQQAGTKRTFRFATGLADTPYEYADNCVIENLSQTAQIGANVTFSGELRLNEPLTGTDPN